MVTASKTLQTGSWDAGYPTKDWADGVDGAIFMFAKAFAAISIIEGVVSLFGGDLDFNKFVTTASMSMVLASHLLQLGKWDTGYPTTEWAEGVGGSLMKFAEAFSNVSDAERGGWFSEDKDFSSFITKSSISMVLASHLLQLGKWDTGYPTKEWADGVGGALITFAKAFADISAAEDGGWFSADKDFSVFITKAATSITLASILLSTGKWESYPSNEWVDGVSYSLLKIAKVVSDADLDDGEMKDFSYFVNDIIPGLSNLTSFPTLDPFVENVNKFTDVINNIPDDKHKAIKNLADSIRGFSSALDEVNVEAIDKLSAISQGVMLVSIIDDVKLKVVLDAISEKKGELKQIYGDEDKKGILEQAGNLFGFGNKDEEKAKTVTIVKDTVDKDKEEFYANTTAMLTELQGIKSEIEALVFSIKSNNVHE